MFNQATDGFLTTSCTLLIFLCARFKLWLPHVIPHTLFSKYNTSLFWCICGWYEYSDQRVNRFYLLFFFFTSNVRLLACPNLNVKSTWSGIKWLKSVLIWGKKNVIKFRRIKSDVQLWSDYLTLLSEVWCQIVIFKSKQIFWKSKRISIRHFQFDCPSKKVHATVLRSFSSKTDAISLR